MNTSYLSLGSTHELQGVLFDAMDDGVLIVDRDGAILDCNPAFHNRLGYTKCEVVGRNVRDLDPPEFAEKVPERIEAILRDGQATFETAHFRKDGTVMPVELNARFCDINGETVMFSIVRDITERKAFEQEHQRRFDMYDAAINTPALGFWVVDTKGRMREVNEAYLEMSGYSRDEFLALSIPDVEAMEHPEEVEAHIKEVMDMGYARFRTAHRRKDGTVWPCEVVANFTQIQGGLFIAFIEDITRQVEQESRLKQAARVYDTMDQAVVVTDADNKIVAMNPAAERISGYAIDDVIGQDPNIFSSGLHDDDFYKAMWDSLRETDHWTGEIWDKHKDGRVFIKNLAINIIRDDHGNVTQHVSVFSDITERKRQEEALQKAHDELDERVRQRTAELKAEVERHRATVQELRIAKERAETANKAKTMFLTNMSHELRTPLNAIIGFSDLIMGETFGPVGNDTYMGYLSDINTSGTHLLKLINDILDVSRLETGKMTVDLTDIRPADIAAKVAPMIRPQATDKDIKLVFDIQDPLPEIRADERRLAQVVVKLMSNAVKFSEPGSSVTLAMTSCPTRGWVDIVIKDQGIGMTPREAVRAQRPFEQVDTRLERRYEGSGLGLSLARSLTELMGGEFFLESEKNKGTTVRVSIPVVS